MISVSLAMSQRTLMASGSSRKAHRRSWGKKMPAPGGWLVLGGGSKVPTQLLTRLWSSERGVEKLITGRFSASDSHLMLPLQCPGGICGLLPSATRTSLPWGGACLLSILLRMAHQVSSETPVRDTKNTKRVPKRKTCPLAAYSEQVLLKLPS